MNTPIAAQSLSSLNHLLSNPPQYPRNPTHAVEQPLVLYIVRVPGSKDVFLTPLKPPTKASISLEAIQSSLYYLHVDTPEDDEVRQSIDEQKSLRDLENVAPAVPRKPLPPVPQIPTTYSRQITNDGAIIGNRPEARTTGLGSYSSPGTISRKPLANRNSYNANNIGGIPQDRLKTNEQIGIHGEQYRPGSFWSDPSTGMEEAGKINTSYGVDGYPESQYNNTLDVRRRSPTRSATSSSPLRQNERTPSITLIRRDPTSGAQWNIGTINQLESSNTESVLHPVAIEIDTLGYGKFTRQVEIPRPANTLSDAASVKDAINAMEQSRASVDRTSPLTTFTRTVEFRQQPSSSRQSRMQSRTSSWDSVPNYPIQNRPSKSVFSFLSPWQGLCTFSNGIDGKSLKCRHTLPSADPQEDRTTTNIAELRFNLPWSVLSPRDANKKQAFQTAEPEPDTLPITSLLKEPKSGKQTWRRSVQHIKNISRDIKEMPLRDRDRRDRDAIESAYAANTGSINPGTQSQQNTARDQEEEGYRLSLTLGREKAGGGFKGNSAKLGKLILEDEGLKMGDLVVAACMSVWWQHYAGGVGS